MNISIILPAFEFYHLPLGTANFQLFLAEDTVINEQFIPKGAIVNTNFEYAGSFSRSQRGDVRLMMIKALSITIDNHFIPLQSNTISLADFADPNNPPLIFVNTGIRFEVPIETTLLFEVEEVVPVS